MFKPLTPKGEFMTQTKEKVKPSVINNTPSKDIRIEMEIDAHELMSEQTYTRHTKTWKWIQRTSYFLLAATTVSLIGVLEYSIYMQEELMRILGMY